MDIFDAYATYYDLLYRDKDYAGEADYVATRIRQMMPGAQRILDLGCGTGKHDEYLARLGFSVHGMDISDEMLSRARERKAKLPADIAEKLSFSAGDIRTVRTGQTYDAVISLFHVMSYQTANSDVMTALQTAADHLKPGGLFVFDFWYGPAVLTQKPEIRVKRLESKDHRVVRIAEPIELPRINSVQVNYQVWVESLQNGQIGNFCESHLMRYFFEPEMDLLMTQSEFKIESITAWLEDSPPHQGNWSALIVAVRQ